MNRTLLISSCHLYTHLGMLTLPAMFIPIMHDFNIGLGAVSWIYTISNLTFGLGALPAGYLIDRIGPKKTLIINIAGFSVALILASLAESPLFLALAFGLVGIFGSLYHPSGLSYLSLTTENPIKAMSIFGIFGNIGLGLGPLIAGGLYVLGGWRLTFAGSGLIGLIILTFIIFSIPEVERRNTTPTDINNKRIGYYIPLFIIGTVIGFIITGITSILPPYSYERVSSWFAGARQIVAGNIVASVIFLIGIVGHIAVSRLKKISCLHHYLSYTLASLTIVLILLAILPGEWSIPFGIMMSPLYFAIQPLMNTLTGTISPEERRGRIYGMMLVLYFGIGSLGAGLGGMIAERFNFSYTFLMFALSSAVAFALTFIVKRRYRLE